MIRTPARLALLLIGCVVAGASWPAFADCVIKPNLPSTPPGCSAMQPDCICDEQGQSCHWIFHCVPTNG